MTPQIKQSPAEAKPFTDLYVMSLLANTFSFKGKSTDESELYDQWSPYLAQDIYKRYEERCVDYFNFYARSAVSMSQRHFECHIR